MTSERALVIAGLILSVATSIPLFTSVGDFPIVIYLLMLVAFAAGIVLLLVALIVFLIRKT